MPKEDITGRSANNDNNKYIIDVNTFSPHSWEEERCLEIAKSLTDMRFILNALGNTSTSFLEV